MPTIEIKPPTDPAPLRHAIDDVQDYDWLVFTSRNGVDYFFQYLEECQRDVRSLAGSRIGAIGSVTAERLREHGIRADLIPEEYTTEGIVHAFAERGDAGGQSFLCPRSDIAPPGLVDGLEGLGADVNEVDAYSVEQDCSRAGEVAELMAEDDVDWVTFTSTSTVENFFGAIDRNAVIEASVRIASIGPATSVALQDYGLEPTVEAAPHTVEALIDAIVEWEK